MVPGGIALLVGILGIIVPQPGDGVPRRPGERQGRALVRRHRRRAHRAAHALRARSTSRRVKGVEVVIGMLLLPILIVGAGLLGARLAARSGKHDQLRLALHRADRQPGAPADGHAGHPLRRDPLFFVAPTGVEFFPTTDPNQILITAEAPVGTTIERSNEVSEEVFGRVAGPDRRGRRDGRQHATNIATSGRRRRRRDVRRRLGLGGALLGHAQHGGLRGPRRALLGDAPPDPPEPRPGCPGVDLQVTQDQGGPPTGAAVNIEVSGKEFDEIQSIANRLKTQLEDAAEAGRVEGLVDIRDNLNSGPPRIPDRDRPRAGGGVRAEHAAGGPGRPRCRQRRRGQQVARRQGRVRHHGPAPGAGPREPPADREPDHLQ